MHESRRLISRSGAILFALGVVIWLYSRESKPPCLVCDDTKQGTYDKIRSAVAIGTDQHQAREVMQESGFACKEIKDDGTRWLFCYRYESRGLLVVREWRILLECDDGQIGRIEVNTAMTGM